MTKSEAKATVAGYLLDSGVPKDDINEILDTLTSINETEPEPYQEPLKVGDEVTLDGDNLRMVVTEIKSNRVECLEISGNLADYNSSKLIKTGRHFFEIEEAFPVIKFVIDEMLKESPF